MPSPELTYTEPCPAILVCYSKSAPNDHGEQRAFYLDQTFYEMIFRHCLVDRSLYPALSVVASLRYKSPLVVIPSEELVSLNRELTYLEKAGHSHPQIPRLRDVCTQAGADGSNLSISGDMYPEL